MERKNTKYKPRTQPFPLFPYVPGGHVLGHGNKLQGDEQDRAPLRHHAGHHQNAELEERNVGDEVQDDAAEESLHLLVYDVSTGFL